MSLPLVSIIITSYNRASTISQSIESSLSQDYKNLEIIITDNCSTDGSDEVIKKYLSDPRITYNRNSENLGMLANFHKAIGELASGKYFVIVNSDDYLLTTDFISKAMALANKYEDVFVIKGKYKTWYENSKSYGLDSYVETKEFYNGKQWLMNSINIEFNSLVNVLGWGAIILDRDEFIKLEELAFPIVYADVFTTLLLMLKGNICFVAEDVLMFRFLNDRQPTYTENQYDICITMLNIIDQIVNHKYNNLPGPDLSLFYKRYRAYIINYYIRLFYSYDKLKFKDFEKYLLNNHNTIYQEIVKSIRWRLYAIMYRSNLFVKSVRRVKLLLNN